MNQEPAYDLAVPALRAHMGDWIYYISFLTMEEISERVSYAEDIHTSKTLRELLQRGLTGSRNKEIKEYLLRQRQRFFNAIVVATYGGTPEWKEVRLRKADPALKKMLQSAEGSLGVLTLSGTEKLFALDGQHRVAGIKSALAEKRALAEEEVCVLFVAGIIQEHRARDPRGFERTRRLFTTLNRYAKPVTKRDIIALDEDDICAILTRSLLEDHPLFREKVSLARGNSIPQSDSRHFTTISAVYDTLDIYLRTKSKWGDFKKLRPSEDVIDDYRSRCEALWAALASGYGPLRELQNSDPNELVAGRYRGRSGGHLALGQSGFY